MSGPSSIAESQVAERPNKANIVNQHIEITINSSDRVFGLDGASDNHGHKYRALSRSPSPYRRKRSPSPPLYRKNRVSSRSPSPYRKDRATSRSRSPYRQNRGDQNSRPTGSRAHHKRKASPPYGNRSDKRLYTDRSRHTEAPHLARGSDRTAGHAHGGFDRNGDRGRGRPHAKPISYAEIIKPSPVPDFSLLVSLDNPTETSSDHQPDSNVSGTGAKESSKGANIEMSSIDNSVDSGTQLMVEKAPTHESREEKRKRWAAMRAAAEQQTPKESLLQQAVLTFASAATTSNVGSPVPQADSPISPYASSLNGQLNLVPDSPDMMIIDKQGGSNEGSSPSGDSPSAAYYNPMQDTLDDRDRAAKKIQTAELSSEAYQETSAETLSVLPVDKALAVKNQKREIDMFADSEDEDEAVVTEVVMNVAAKGTVLDEKLLDNWDDPEGYYKLISNELVNGGRYQIIKVLGRGVFANVAQATEVSADTVDRNGNFVAIKMIRRNELMRKASQKEMDFLRKVNEADPLDKRHIIRLLGSFDHKGHLCIVFEHMSKNLRDLLKEETNGHGLALPAVRTYARQMFLGLQHLQDCQVIHLDLKPDNVLVSQDKKLIKLADFGTAVDRRDQIERTEYLVSRFYRAPEIILGMEIGYAVDMWAIGCTVYELWTGKILFTGRSNNQMIKAFMDCLGWPSEKLLKKGLVNNVLDNFEIGPPLRFISREVDQHNKISVRKIEQQKKIPRDMKTRVHEASRGIQNGPPVTELNDLTDLLCACLHMNVEKRISPKEAIGHKFLISKCLAPKAATGVVVKPPLMKRGMPGSRR